MLFFSYKIEILFSLEEWKEMHFQAQEQPIFLELSITSVMNLGILCSLITTYLCF